MSRLRHEDIGESSVMLLVEAGPSTGGLPSNIRRLRSVCPNVKVLILGLEDCERKILQYVQSGACGYLLKKESFDDLVGVIEAAYNNEFKCAPNIASRVMARIQELVKSCDGTMDTDPELTPRELEILELIAEGLSNKEIAQRLDISPSTVKNHVHNLLAKLKVGRRGKAVWCGYEKGLLRSRFLGQLKSGLASGSE
ncbi:MAG TPA: response regulator transcription factor [Acidobacteriota bacterium]|nr:response regulator transcription factor [Acidobacteriota bacterium]